MKLSIQLKIILIYLCTIFMIMIISGTFIVYNIEARDYKSLQSELEQLADAVEIMDMNKTEITKSVVALNKQIYQLDGEGRVIWGSNTTYGSGEFVPSEVVIRAIKDKKSALGKFKHFTNIITGAGEVDYARPILDELGNIRHIIYISGRTDQIVSSMKSVMSTLVTSLIVAMFTMGGFSIFFARMITSPIKELTKSAKKLATGNFISRIPLNSNDEIGELTQSFNYMASQLSSNMESLTSEKNKLEKIFEHMADGVMAFNRQGILIHANSVCYDMIGIVNMGHRFEDIFSNVDHETKFGDMLNDKEDTTIEKLIVLDDKYLSMHFDVYRNSKREPDGLVVVIQDVTKQQKLDEMRKEFVANVSHELRTPLTTVKSYTETLIDGAIEDRDMAIHFLGVMEKEADRMTALVQDLLELSRIDNRQIQLNMTKVDLMQIVDDVLEAQVIHIEKAGHKLFYHVNHETEYAILGDSTRIKQVVHNIVSNAIKYSVDPGNITVSLAEDEGSYKLKIADTGLGIPANDLDRIFERFYRVDKARSRKLGGTGLGLSIAKELIELHKGTIHIESKVGEGTTVIITLQRYNEN